MQYQSYGLQIKECRLLGISLEEIVKATPIHRR